MKSWLLGEYPPKWFINHGLLIRAWYYLHCRSALKSGQPHGRQSLSYAWTPEIGPGSSAVPGCAPEGLGPADCLPGCWFVKRWVGSFRWGWCSGLSCFWLSWPAGYIGSLPTAVASCDDGASKSGKGAGLSSTVEAECSTTCPSHSHVFEKMHVKLKENNISVINQENMFFHHPWQQTIWRPPSWSRLFDFKQLPCFLSGEDCKKGSNKSTFKQIIRCLHYSLISF